MNRYLMPAGLRLAPLLALFAVAGCSDIQTPEEGFNSARAKWTRNGPVSYVMTIHFSCNECGANNSLTGPVIVDVYRGRIRSKVYASSGIAVVAPHYTGFPSIEELFTVIDMAIRNDAQFIAEYDPRLGYPLSVHTAPGDNDWVYTVTAFEAK